MYSRHNLKALCRVPHIHHFKSIIRNITLTTQQTQDVEVPSYFSLCDKLAKDHKQADSLINTMTVFDNFLSEDEENSLMNELDPYMKKLRYEFDHWDDAIHGYRETERLKWNEANMKIIERVRKLAFPPEVAPIKYVHILDLDKNGWIKAHIDAVRVSIELHVTSK